MLDAEAGLLFTARSWCFQERLAANLAARHGSGCHALQGVGDEGAEDATHPRAGVAPDALRRLFPDADTPEGADAFAAAAALAASNFGVLTGGPGTGKTTAAARLLAAFLLAEEAAGRNPADLKIALATPTGKAAERLTASIRSYRARPRRDRVDPATARGFGSVDGPPAPRVDAAPARARRALPPHR